MHRFLMCPPKYYGVEYEINPWMHIENPANHQVAWEQWERLYQVLLSFPEVEVELIEPAPGLPDMVFTANAGLVYGDIFIPSHFRHPERRGESPYYEEWFQARGFRIKRLPEDIPFEGAGDVLQAGGRWFGGYYFRSDPQAHAALSEIIRDEILPLRLMDERFYHLDTCFAAIGNTAIYYPDAFDSYSLTVLRDLFPDGIEVAHDEALTFVCNAVVIGNRVIINASSPKLCRTLSSRGYQCHPTPLTEFIKAGGSAKCLTLEIGAG